MGNQISTKNLITSLDNTKNSPVGVLESPCKKYQQNAAFENPHIMNTRQLLSVKKSNQTSVMNSFRMITNTTFFNQIPVLIKGIITFLLLMGMNLTADAQQCGTLARWDIASCTSDLDFSEFTPSIPGTACVNVSASNFMLNGSAGGHSCNPGRPSGDGVGICKAGFTSATYDPTSTVAFKFEVTIPAASVGSITKISFWEYSGSPIEFLSSPGSTFTNNYPTKYGVRVLKNGAEIHVESELPTSTNWTLEELNFTDIDFAYTGGETFTFLLYAYSPAGLTGTSHEGVWDIDEVTVEGCCGNPGDVCKSTNADQFSVAAVPGATSYNWTLSGAGGGSIVSGQGTNSINIDWTGGTIGEQTQICVEAIKDGCASSPTCTIVNIIDCGTNTGNGWAFDCGEDVEVEIVGTGTNSNSNTTLNFTNVATIDSIVVEAVHKNGTAPASMTFSSATQTEIAYRIPVNNGGNNQGVYRFTMDPTSSITLSTSTPSTTWSFVAYVFRSNTGSGGSPSVGQYNEDYLYYVNTPTSETYTLSIPISSGPKNLEIKVPISELSVDTRIARITASAGGVTQTIEVDQPNLGTSLNITPFTLSNVPGNISTVTITVESPDPTTDPAGKTGDSFLVGAIYVGVDCSDNLTASATGSNLNCYGETNGTVTLTVNGGITPLTYNWSNGATTQNLTNVPAGTYSVTVTDGASNTTIASATVTQPNALQANAVGTAESSANADDGSAIANPIGGTPGYTYSWSTGATSQSISGLTPGTYTVTVTDANGCTAIQSIVVEPFICDLAVSTSTLQHVTCNSGNDGRLRALPTGGTGPYAYLWSTGATSQTVTNLTAGTYTVTVTDSKGCTAGASGIINEPTQIVTQASSTNETALNANDGTATANPIGGTPGYTYAWSNGGSTKSISNLAPGNYTVTVTDSRGCTATETITITEVTCGVLGLGISKTEPACNGQSIGTATANPSGGQAPYSYAWSNSSTAQTITGLAAGTYTVTVTDNLGCSANGTVTITQPSPLSAGSVGTNVTCNGASDGTVELTVSGGVAPYSYAWSNGATTEDLSSLPPGSYTVVITDVNGCQTFSGASVTEPNVLIANATSTNETALNADDGTVTATPTGGTAAYTYLWNTGSTNQTVSGLVPGTYTVTVTDANGCTSTESVVVEPFICDLDAIANSTDVSCNGGANGTATVTGFDGTLPYSYAWSTSPVQTGATATGLSAGTYTVTITDAKGCTAGASTIVEQPGPIVLSLSATGESSLNANDGTATVIPAGGSTPYTYLWSANSGGQGTQTATNLAPGTYSVTVTDANNCTAVASVTVTGISCASFSVGSTKNDITCNGQTTGSATASPSGGQAPYSYVWSANTGGQTSQTAVGLSAGTYTVTVQDAVGCSEVETITITQPAPLSAGNVATNISCHSASDGTIDLTVSGGTAPYAYAWSNGETTQDLSGLSPANYTVVITDANGCQTFSGAVITQPAAIIPNAISTNETALNADDGTASVSPSGGTTPYTYLWSTGATTQSVSGLLPGTYSVTVTDANGCTAVESVVVEPYICDLDAIANSTDADCNGGNDGTATATSFDGTAPYTYLWSNGQTTQTATGLVAGTYTVTITDSKGCTAGASTVVEEPTAIIPNVSVTGETSFGANDGTASVTPTGGTNPYTYLWSDGQTTQMASNLAPGTYTVTVTDANGCTAVATATISAINCAAFTAGVTGTNVDCNATSTGSATANPQNGTAPFSYSWSNGGISQVISGLAAGTYTVTVTDNVGCSTTASVVITQPSVLSAGVVSTMVTCFQADDATIDLTVSGGTAPYTYAWTNGATTQDLSNISAGNYQVVVTDANGCQAFAGSTITEPNELLANPVSTNETANNADDGTAEVIPTGGTTAYTYLWSTGATTSAVTGLAPGTYSVTVTDANGCEDIATVTIQEFGCTLTATIARDNNVTCNGGADGSATVSPLSGNAPYTYAWNTSLFKQEQLLLV